MLNTAADYESSIKFLTDGINDEMNKGLSYQTYSFDSDAFNSTFDLLEARLNKLYEKTRIMDDVISYTKTYLEQTIYDTTKECRSILNSLEDNRDKLKTNAYISYDVPLLESNGSYIDRDNTQIPHCNISNGLVTISSRTQTALQIKTIERKVGPVPYKSSLDNLKQDGIYRAFYLLESPINNGLSEDIYIELQTPTAVNYIDILPSNCKISNIRYIDENNAVEYEDNFASIITRDRKIKAIQLTLNSKLYKTSTYYIDQSRMATDFWDKVSNAEYNYASTGTSDIADLDVAAGLAAFKTAYADYSAKMKSWKEFRQAVANQNNANGYSDSVPYTDFLLVSDGITSSDRINKSPFNADPYPSAEQNIRYINGGK